MKLANLFTAACLVAGLAAPACKKEEDKAPTPATGSAGSSASVTEPASEPDARADHITVLAHHKNPKPSDPVRINFEKFRVVKADFDPQKIEGGTATIEIALSSFRTDSDERDEHLKSPAYLDVAKLATATITIANVKQKAGATYAADATVVAHGITKTYPITFDVLDRKADRITIKGTHTFGRLDFGIGSDPAQNPEEQVGTDVTIEMVLTITKS
ncbi:MAG TPA: YceI family protein [Kofleriaceae bacterium]|nr:YceI family protein [Kofleriaceae bacterium]